MSSDLDFLMDKPFTEMDFLTEQTETSEMSKFTIHFVFLSPPKSIGAFLNRFQIMKRCLNTMQNSKI